MGKLANNSVWNLVRMSKLCHRLWVAISVSTLAIVSSAPVLAKPHPRFPAIVTSQAEQQTSVTDDRISPPPVEAVLARAKFKSATPVKVVRSATLPIVNSRSIVKVTPTVRRVKNSRRQIGTARALQGISHFIDTDRVPAKDDNFSAVNRLID